MISRFSVVWGGTDVARAVEFWCAALDYVPRRTPSADWAILVPREGTGTQLSIKLVTSAQAHRHHIDLFSTDQAADVARLKALGAVEPAWNYEGGAEDYVVLQDPDGNPFCVVQLPKDN